LVEAIRFERCVDRDLIYVGRDDRNAPVAPANIDRPRWCGMRQRIDTRRTESIHAATGEEGYAGQTEDGKTGFHGRIGAVEAVK